MPRFSKGTLDHDGNGKAGGSKPQKRAPKAKKPLDPAEQSLVRLGAHARRGGRRREDCPLTGKDAELWLRGWDSQAI